jgi:hypothetical protein
MTDSEVHGNELLDRTQDWRAIAILEAVHKYGAITKGEAVCRIGGVAAGIALKTLIDQSLLAPLNGHRDSDVRKVFGLTDRAKRLFRQGKTPREILEKPEFLRWR